MTVRRTLGARAPEPGWNAAYLRARGLRPTLIPLLLARKPKTLSELKGIPGLGEVMARRLVLAGLVDDGLGPVTPMLPSTSHPGSDPSPLPPATPLESRMTIANDVAPRSTPTSSSEPRSVVMPQHINDRNARRAFAKAVASLGPELAMRLLSDALVEVVRRTPEADMVDLTDLLAQLNRLGPR